jgi:YidC/Oxa1 family membrane protein insertase
VDDRRLILGLLICFLTIIAYYSWVKPLLEGRPREPEPAKTRPSRPSHRPGTEPGNAALPAADDSEDDDKPPEVKDLPPAPEPTGEVELKDHISVETRLFRVALTNRGAAVKSVVLRDYYTYPQDDLDERDPERTRGDLRLISRIDWDHASAALTRASVARPVGEGSTDWGRFEGLGNLETAAWTHVPDVPVSPAEREAGFVHAEQFVRQFSGKDLILSKTFLFREPGQREGTDRPIDGRHMLLKVEIQNTSSKEELMVRYALRSAAGIVPEPEGPRRYAEDPEKEQAEQETLDRKRAELAEERWRLERERRRLGLSRRSRSELEDRLYALTRELRRVLRAGAEAELKAAEEAGEAERAEAARAGLRRLASDVGFGRLWQGLRGRILAEEEPGGKIGPRVREKGLELIRVQEGLDLVERLEAAKKEMRSVDSQRWVREHRPSRDVAALVATLEGEDVDLETYDADDVEEEPVQHSTARGSALYAGVRNRYFSAVMKPLGEEGQIERVRIEGIGAHNVSAVLELVPERIKPGETLTREYLFFVGPRAPEALEDYAEHRFEALLDYPWPSSIVRLLSWLLQVLRHVTPNYGFAIILLTIMVRGMLHPLTLKSQKSAHKMQQVQPLIAAVKEKYKDDKRQQQQEVMKVMREQGANPLGGCLPMLLQLPIFFGLWRSLYQNASLRHSPFILWINDLSKADNLIAFEQPLPFLGITSFNLLPLLCAGAMLFQQSMAPKSEDPQAQQQQKMMKIMPLVFCFLLYGMPSGLMVYFLSSSLFGLGEQYFIRRRLAAAAGADESGPGVPVEQKKERGQKPAPQQRRKRRKNK